MFLFSFFISKDSAFCAQPPNLRDSVLGRKAGNMSGALIWQIGRLAERVPSRRVLMVRNGNTADVPLVSGVTL